MCIHIYICFIKPALEGRCSTPTHPSQVVYCKFYTSRTHTCMFKLQLFIALYKSELFRPREIKVMMRLILIILILIILDDHNS